jgi:DNA-binding SARP family transcriptional activator/tetratricopeptide (TPR) repeat protein
MGGIHHMHSATVRVLGSVVVEGPAGSIAVRGRQPSAVAAFIALAGRPVARDELAELLWGDDLSIHWPSALRGVVSKVRSRFVSAGFPATSVRSDATVVSFAMSDVRTDLELIEQLVESSDPCEADLAAAAATLAQPFLPHDDSIWGRHVRERIGRVARRVTQRHVQVLRADGRVDHAVSALRSMIALDPLDESSSHLLIETLIGAGRRAEASETLEQLTSTLADEFGITPSPSTSALLRAPVDVVAPGRWSARARAGIHPHSDEPFVGRARELSTLRRVWGEVAARRRAQLVVVEGPAGSGKTRLVDRFYNERFDDVATILWGRSREAGHPSFGALAEAVQRVADDAPSVIDDLGVRGSGLWPLLTRPTVAGSSADDSTSDGPSIRDALVESLRALLAAVAHGPTIWFVDDLQWASPDVVSIMEPVLDDLGLPVLVIVTTRSVPDDVAARLATLQRVLPTTAVKLAELSVDEVAELLEDAALAPSVQARTGGLAFFASEIARQARHDDGALDASTVPDTIADWVLRRVQALPSAQRTLIELASVIGHVVDLRLLEHSSSLDAQVVAESCDMLVTRGLLVFDSEDSLQFAHAITREVIYDNMGLAVRMRLHRRLADGLATLHRDHDSSENHAPLAHHYRLAGPDAAMLAWTHTMRAARQSMHSGAWSSAASSYQNAVDRAPTSQRRAQALVGAGRAHLAQGSLDEARRRLREAIDLADAHDLAAVRATATLALVGFAGRGASENLDDHEQEHLIRSALAVVEQSSAISTPRSLELRADLERELGTLLLLHGGADERNQLFHRALAHARSIEPARPRAVARALLGVRYAKLDPGSLASRIADAREVLAMPARELRSDVHLSALCYLHEDLLRCGDWDEAERVLSRAEELTGRYRHSYWTWATRTWRALRLVDLGDLDAAEADARDAAALQAGTPAAEVCLLVNLIGIRLQQQRSDEMIPMLQAAVAAHPEIPSYRAVLALCAAESDDLGLAGEHLRWFSERRFMSLHDDPDRCLGLSALAHVAATIADAEAGARLRQLLQPSRDQWVVLQCYGGGGATWGPTTHALARLSALLGDLAEASALYDDAARMASRSPVTSARIERDRVIDLGSLPSDSRTGVSGMRSR